MPIRRPFLPLTNSKEQCVPKHSHEPKKGDPVNGTRFIANVTSLDFRALRKASRSKTGAASHRTRMNLFREH